MDDGNPDIPSRVAEIEKKHREEDRALCERLGVPDLLSAPTSEWMALREEQRLDWVEYTHERDGTTSSEKRTGLSKADLIMKFAESNVDRTVTVKALASAGGCSESTVYKVISDHPGHFRMLGGGRYTLLDPAAERAREDAASAPPEPVAQRTPPVRTESAVDPMLAFLSTNPVRREQS